MIRAATTASLSSCRTAENRFAIVDSKPPTTTPIRPNQAALTLPRLHLRHQPHAQAASSRANNASSWWDLVPSLVLE